MNRYYTSIEDKQLGSGLCETKEDIMVLRKI